MEQIIIQSDTNNIGRVEDFICNVCDEKNVHNYFATIDLAVLHAVENAVIHGNKSDASKRVTVSCDDCRGGVCFVVQDEGAGFDYQKYGGMPMGDDCGVGIFMINRLTDRVEYSDGGRCVRLEFNIMGVDKYLAAGRAMHLQDFYNNVKVGV